MASSSLFELTNIVLRTTGDLAELSDSGGTDDVANASGGIGKRITDFFNLTIGAIEKRSNWSVLRFNATGVADGTNDVYEFIGSNDLRAGGTVSVWMAGQGMLEELTAEQFDKRLAEDDGANGVPTYFNRQSNASGILQIQIYPTPASGEVINVSAYQKATKFTQPPVDTETTQFDDDILVNGVLMHLDLYDQIDRGYATLFKDQLDISVMESISNRQIRIEADSYR